MNDLRESMFAALYIPDFWLQAVLRHEPQLRGQPVGLLDPGANLVQLTAAAKRFGLIEGLTPSQALARCPHLILKTRCGAQEQSATEILLQTACSFSAHIESTGPGLCLMDLKGLPVASVPAGRAVAAAPLRQWAEKILESLAPFYLEARVGIAPAPELAALAAQRAAPVLVVEDGAAFAATLGIEALAPPDLLGILSRWGIRTAGEFVALGRDGIAERLGAPALQLFERLSSCSIRPLKRISPPETFCERIEFENEIETAAPLLFVLRRFVEQLSRRLGAIYLVVGQFQLRLGLSSGGSCERVFEIPSPTGDIDVLFRMLQAHLETLRTDSPIVSLELAATPARPETHQFGLFESTLRNPNQFADTLARLAALVGPENVGTPVLEPTHRPDSFRMSVPRFDEVPAPAVGASRAPEACGPQLRRFRPPLSARVEFRGHEPALMRSQVFNGPIRRSRGPYLSSGQWWDAGRWTREEWDVQASDGSLFRIYLSPEGCFVEGVYD